MNQGFKLRFDQMRESDPTPTEAPLGAHVATMHAPPGYARNVCLIWPDGRQFFLNYAYLIAAEFDPNGEKNQIKIGFSSHTVLLEGYGLDRLFLALLDNLPRLIIAADPRYVLEEDKAQTIVTAIIVEKKEE